MKIIPFQFILVRTEKKTSFGKKTKGIIRSTFIIDEKGVVEKIWHPAKASKNVLEVVNYLNQEV